MRFDELQGSLLPVDEVREAMEKAATALVRVLEAVPAHAADLAAAVAKDGEQGARRFLKELVRNTRERLSASMKLLGAESDLEASDTSH